MCGIAGIWNWSEPEMAQHNIKLMTDKIIHRGPDGEGFWHKPDIGLSLGHRRLSIIDLSESASQPMKYMNRYVITFNGEIYNYIELKEYLRSKGYFFSTQSDTEVIMAAFDFWDTKCLEHFDGMFAFAIFDELRNFLFCARDRFGEKPFYYYHDKNKFLFASEIKAFSNLKLDKELDEYLIFLFLNYNLHENPLCIENTFFKNIKKLIPGHYFIFKSNQTIIQKKYWNINLHQNSNKSFQDAQIEFKELFFNSVRRRLRSDVPVGTSLSGGLDSSSVVLTMDSIIQETQNLQKTFSARFPDTKFDEGFFISKVTENKNIQQYFTYPNLDNMIKVLPKIMYHQEEPFASASIYAQWEVFKLASENNVVVLLDGQGADEYLAGYTHFFLPFFREIYSNEGKKSVQKKYNEYISNNIAIQEPLKLNFKFFLESRFSGFYHNLSNLKHRFFGIQINPNISLALKNNYSNLNPPFFNHQTLNESLYYHTFVSGLEKLLRFADKNSMAFSREVRLPFLNHDLVKFVFDLPSEYKIYNGWTKGILRYALQELLPQEIAWRKNKLGFQPPQNEWLTKKEWKDWAYDYHSICVRNQWIKKESLPDWKSVNLGLFQKHFIDVFN